MRSVRRAFLASLLLSGAVVSGCASTAKGVKSSAMRGGGLQELNQQAPSGTALAVVRYPAFVNTEAENAFNEAFGANAIGGSAKKADPIEVAAVADGMVLKSNYFAMSLYRELVDRLPEHSVLLSPHEIKLDDEGELTSEPMTSAESLPSVVTVDFTAYSFPNIDDMMGGKPLTFGDLVTPVVTVRTDPRASVSTEGVLLASAPVIGAAAATNRAQAMADADTLQQGRFDPGVPELDIVATLRGDAAQSVPTARLMSTDDIRVEVYDIEKVRLQGAAIRSLNQTKMDVLEAPFTNGFANQIIRLINETDADKAAMFKRADAVAGYDESLAALTLVGSKDADYQARARYADRLLEAEQKYLSVQSLRLYDGIINGEMGAQVRDILQAENNVLSRRRKLAQQQNIATAASVLAVVGTVAAGSAGGCKEGESRSSCRQRAYNRQQGQTLLLQSAIFAAQEAFRQNRLSKSVATNYIQSVLPALNATTEVQVDLIDSNETITAIRFDDLRDKLSELYAENQRALDTIATRCSYSAPTQGTWLGACENGTANGSGVGVWTGADGALIEHYGYARSGLADGPGYRIVRAPEGSYSLEGNFSAGEANGVMRVERSGEVQLRTYSNGRDAGSAPSGAAVASPFTN